MRQLQESETGIKLLAKSIDNISESIFITDLEGKVMSVNKVFTDTYGYEQKEIIGAGINLFLSERYGHEEVEKMLEEAKKGTWQKEQFHRKKDGEDFAVNFSLSAIKDDTGAVIALKGIIKKLVLQKIREKIIKEEILSMTENNGDDKEISFKDLFNIEEIQKIQDEFSLATGVYSVIVDEDYRQITRQSNPTYLCEKIIKGCERGLESCMRSNEIRARSNLFATNFGFCQSAGFLEGAAPIIIGKKLIATWIIGQVREIHDKDQKLLKYADKLGLNREVYKKHLSKVPRIPMEQFSKICETLYHITYYMSVLALKNFEQARIVAKSNQSELLQNILFNISNAAIISDSLGELIDKIRMELMRYMDVTNFYVALYHDERNDFYLPYFKDENDGSRESWKVQNLITGMVVKQKKQLIFLRKEIKKLCKSRDIKITGEIPEIWIGTPLIDGDKVMGAFVVQNYTDKNEYNENSARILSFISYQISLALRKKRNELETKEALAKARESDKMKSIFLAKMSHELRTPLNAIIGFSTLLDRDTSKDEVEEFAGYIRKSGKRLLSVYEDIFETVLLESGEFNLQYNVFSVNDLLHEAAKAIVKERDDKGESDVDLKINFFNEEEDILLVSDRDNLKQVLIILLRNAFKFTQVGEVVFGVKRAEANKTGNLEIYVKDTGIGISADRQEYIFKAFTQSDDDSYNRRYDGLGLGLFIAKKIAEKLGGELNYEANKPVGSVFKLTIPLIQDDTGGNLSSKQGINPAKNKMNANVIVATDDESVFSLLSAILSLNGFLVVRAKSGIDALKISLNNPFVRMVMLDSQLNDIKDYLIVDTIKKRKNGVPVVILTSKDLNGNYVELINKCDDVLELPLNQEKFNTMLLHCKM